MSVRVAIDMNAPEIREEIERRVRLRLADTLAERENDEDEDRETALAILGHLQDARRMLTRAEPSASEALIYIERALVDVNTLT